jgi:lipid A oxidase
MGNASRAICARSVRRQVNRTDALIAAAGLLALFTWTLAAPASILLPSAETPSDERPTVASKLQSEGLTGTGRWEHLIGGYSGVSLTLPSTVRIVNPGRTDLTVQGFNWIGRPFKSPIYYGLRSQHWAPGSPLGGMIDFTHAKAIATAGDTATFTGTINGQPAPSKAKIEDVFRHLEFSHGHNIVTLNGLMRLPSWFLPIRPYIGLGGGITLPHTEVGLQSENKRTYEYQFAGFAAQVLVGIQLPISRLAPFVEYKFTFAPYTVPLSHEPQGWVLVTDLWRQFRAWAKGEPPPGGYLSTDLATHHGIGGVLFRATPARIAN